MSIASRLQKATHSLAPHQRAVLVLQATREAREPDPELRRFEDETQRRAFNRYMALFWVANQHLGSVAGITAYRVELARTRPTTGSCSTRSPACVRRRRD